MSQLESIFSYSFPANHLLQFSIVKQEADQSYKKAFFCFITIAPGVQNQQGNRTFDFNNRITMKVEAYQLSELAHAMRIFARGQDSAFGNFSIYVDSGKSQYGQGGGGKSMSIQRTTNQKQNNAPAVTFFFKQGQNAAIGYSMTIYRALAIADKLEFMSEKCDELEFLRGPATIQTGAYENPSPAPSGMSPQPFGGAQPPPFGDSMTTPQNVMKPETVAQNFSGSFAQFDDDVPF